MSFNKAQALKNASKYVRQGKHRAAIQEYSDILKADPTDTTTLNLLGDLYVRVNAIPDAVRTFARVADLYCHSGRSTKAIAVLKKACKLDPENLDSATRLAHLYAQEGLIAEAQQQCLVVAESYLRAGLKEQGFNIYRQLIQRNPDNADFRLRLAEASLRDDLRDQAHDAFFDAAEVLRAQGKHEEALKTFLRAVGAQPAGRAALKAAVNIYLQRGETQPAESLIKHLLRARPDDAELLTLLGHVQQMEVALAEARGAIARAVEEDPQALQYQVELVSACDRAYLTFMTAVAELQRQGRERDALNACLKALRLKPGDKPALFVAVNLYLKLGDTQSAVVTLRHTLRAQPENVELLRLLGSVYQQAHDAASAEQVIRQAVALQPSCYRDALDFAGYCVRQGDLDRALRQVDSVLEAHDEPPVQLEALELLRGIIARDSNHLGALERLVNIHTRRYDAARQVEALNALASAALFKGEDETAARALRWLVQLEPHEIWHRRLLRKLCPLDESVQHLAPEPAECAAQAERGLELAKGEAAVERGLELVAEGRGVQSWESAVGPGHYELAYGSATAGGEAVLSAECGEEAGEEMYAADFVAAPMPVEVSEPRAAGGPEIETRCANADSVYEIEIHPRHLAAVAGAEIHVVQAERVPELVADPPRSAPAVAAQAEAQSGPPACAAPSAPVADEQAAPAAQAEPPEEALHEVFVSASERRRRRLRQNPSSFARRAAWRSVGGASPRRFW
jgi:tetratricopeptide (TPR) repeat protein